MLRTVVATTLLSLAALGLQASQDKASPRSTPAFIQVTVKKILPEVGVAKRLRLRDRHIVVLSRTDDSLIEVDTNYKVVRRIGSIGSAPGEIYQAEDFDIAPDGTIWIADRGNDRIQGLSWDGRPIGSFKLRAPGAIAALPSGELAVVQQFDSAVIHLFRRDGQEVRTIGETTPVEGATEAQTNYFNRAKLTATRSGDILAAFRFLVPATARVYGTDGRVKATLAPTSVDVTRATMTLAGARLEDLKKSNLGGKVSLTGSAVDSKGFIWLAPAGVASVFKFAPDGRQLQEYRFKGEDGQDFGVHDLVFDNERVLAVSGPFIVAGKIPQ